MLYATYEIVSRTTLVVAGPVPEQDADRAKNATVELRYRSLGAVTPDEYTSQEI
jgi:hypothetical protein